MSRIRKILVPTDFSESSQAALQQAAELARALDASLELLHVWEVPVFLPGELIVSNDGSQGNLIDYVRDRANQRLAALVARSEQEGIHFSAVSCILSIPHATIVDLATADKHDLIVVGSHGRTGFKRALLGSVAERVVRHAPCTVVVARAPRSVPPSA
ncbi:MAG TPA: universal stress protein [Polyangiaceae bacterium]|nr:universal stress protein [Polyangiaceae bacterium]